MTANSERLTSVGGEGGEGGRSTVNSERLTCVGVEGGEGRGGEGGFNRQATQIGSAANLERICTALILRGRGVDQQPTQIGSAANLERIFSVDPGGG